MKKSLLQPRNVFLLLLGVVLTPMAFALSDADWKFRQAFEVAQGGAVKVALPLETLDHLQADLRDLRLVAADGTEVPFALVRAASAPARWQPAEHFSVSLENTSTVILIESDTARAWEAVDLAIPTPSFLKAAKIETSADGKTWQTWKDGVPIFRRDGAEQTTLSLPSTTKSTHLRITLDDTRQPPIIVTSARLREPASADTVLEPVAVRIAQTDEYAGETALTLALPAANLDLEGLEVVTPDGLFTRGVRTGVRRFEEGEIEERILANDTIYRLRLDDSPPAEKTAVSLGLPVPVRELVLHVENGDSSPLRVTEIRGTRRLVYVAFEARTAGRFEFWSGNAQGAAPRYDLANLAGSLRKIPASPVRFDRAAENTKYRQPDLLAGLALEGAALQPTEWSHRRMVRLAGAGSHLLELDLAALSIAQPSLADLRLVRADKQVPYLVERTRLARAVELTSTLQIDSKAPSVSRWSVSLPYRGAPITQLALSSSTALFQRDVRVFERRPSGNGDPYEVELGRASWRRTPQEGEKSLTLPLSSPQGTELWIQTENGDNPAIVLTRVRAFHPVTRLLFHTSTGDPLALLSGNSRISAPRYDLNLVAPTLLASEKATASLDPAEASQEAPTTHAGARTALFWGALALVVVALLVVVAKLLPKPPPQG